MDEGGVDSAGSFETLVLFYMSLWWQTRSTLHWLKPIKLYNTKQVFNVNCGLYFPEINHYWFTNFFFKNASC